MGEIVRVIKDGVFPSDLMLINSNLSDSICFIETGTLDGEINIKKIINVDDKKFIYILNRQKSIDSKSFYFQKSSY